MKSNKLNKVLLGLLLLFLVTPSFIIEQASKTQKPNIILIITDDLGYNNLSGHGNPLLKTLEIDEIPQRSISRYIKLLKIN